MFGGLYSFRATGSSVLAFQGDWDANANNPTLASGVGSEGDLYRVSVAGTTNLDGISSWDINDFAFFTGGVWTKQDNTPLWFPDANGINSVTGIGINSPSISGVDLSINQTGALDAKTRIQTNTGNIIHEETSGAGYANTITAETGINVLYDTVSPSNTTIFEFRSLEDVILRLNAPETIIEIGGTQAPSVVTNKLYAVSGDLFWENNHVPLSTIVFDVPGSLIDNAVPVLRTTAKNDMKVADVTAKVKIAPTGQAIILDVLVEGVSIYASTPANRPTIAALAFTSTTAGAPDTTAIAKGDFVELVIVQVGSTVAGSVLSTQVIE